MYHSGSGYQALKVLPGWEFTRSVRTVPLRTIRSPEAGDTVEGRARLGVCYQRLVS